MTMFSILMDKACGVCWMTDTRAAYFHHAIQIMMCSCKLGNETKIRLYIEIIILLTQNFCISLFSR